MTFEIRYIDKLRSGQKAAIDMIESRVRRGESTTTVVLPCRYGKSDVMRLTAVQLWATGQAVTSIALSPGENLRNQLGSIVKWDNTMRRCGVTLKGRSPAINTIKKPKAGILCKFNPNNEAFLSATIQLVQNNLFLFSQWVESEVHRTGLPVVVFIDECHNSSDENEWGKIVPELIAAGAHIVLLTATPERSDDRPIPGFDYQETDSEDVTINKVRDHHTDPDLITVEKYEGVMRKMELVAHVSRSFRDAWAEQKKSPDGQPEEPPILCRISRVGFNPDLSFLGAGAPDGKKLSELSVTEAKKYLGRIIRDPAVIRCGVAKMVDGLLARRAYRPEFQAIIYCANDLDDNSPNAHPVEIALAIREECDKRGIPHLTVKTATSADFGADTIEKFAGTDKDGGEGDILIVKQMAGQGLDLPWVKVGLDLSPTRTYSMYIQRLFRPATPCGGALTCEWITPDDPMAVQFFKRAVTDQGGEARTTDLDLVDSYDKKRKDSSDDISVMVNGISNGQFEDSHGHIAAPEKWEMVADLVSKAPAMTSVYTHAQIAEIAEALFGHSQVSDSDEQEGSAATGRDTSAAAGALRDVIVRLVKDATTLQCAIDRRKGIQPDYSSIIESLYKQIKKESSWPRGVKISESDDLDALYRLKEAAEKL